MALERHNPVHNLLPGVTAADADLSMWFKDVLAHHFFLRRLRFDADAPAGFGGLSAL